MNVNKKKSKKYRSIFRLLKFIIVLSLVMMIFSLPFMKYRKYGSQYPDIMLKERNIDAEQENSIDVAFIGDSIGWAGFSPLNLYANFGYTSYNCCTSGQLPQEGYLILEHMLQRQRPRLVVIEENIFYSHMIDAKYAVNYLWPIFQYHYAYKFRDSSPLPNYAKGYTGTDNIVPYTGSLDYMRTSKKRKWLGIANTYYLEKIVNLCESEGIQMIILGLPNVTWNSEKNNGVQAFCQKYQLTYIDYNTGNAAKDLGIDWQADTRDGGEHLNNNGSLKVVRLIGKMLKQKYSLPDHRDDSHYSDWNQLAIESGYQMQEIQS